MSFQSMVHRLNPKHYPRDYRVATIVEGRETTIDDRRIYIAANSTTAVLQTQPGGTGTPWVPAAPAASVTQAQMVQFVRFIEDGSFTPGSYRDVIYNAQWRAFYNVAARALQYIDQSNTPTIKPAVDSVPCFDCELVLPTRNVTIDHQRPQEGNPVEATCKLFRALGLTKGDPDGPKGDAIRNAHMGNVGGVAGRANAPLRKRYTLNNVGQIYFTIADWEGFVDSGDLDKACLHHVVNLRPLCNACNTSNRNVAHYA